MKKCALCGTEFDGIFCPCCGKKYEEEKHFCRFCGNQLNADDVFCSACGKAQFASAEPSDNNNEEKFTGKIKKALYDMAGEDDEINIKLADLFTGIFKKHDTDEAEKIFICGTKTTTPKLFEINTSWPHPWLYSRVFLVMFIASLFMYLCIDIFSSTVSLAGFITLGSFTVPLACLFFFFEINAPQNISFYKILQYFLVGGCASLLVTLVLYSLFPSTSFIEAIITAIVEELGKMIIVACIIAKSKPKYRLNGIVIGAAVGTGFAAMESTGYAMMYGFNYGFETMMDVIFLRGFLAPGGHIVWAAISGYAIVLANGNENFSLSSLTNPKFLKLFAIPVILHAIWDMPIDFLSDICGIQILLTVASWCVMLVLISASLKQVNDIVKHSLDISDISGEIHL